MKEIEKSYLNICVITMQMFVDKKIEADPFVLIFTRIRNMYLELQNANQVSEHTMEDWKNEIHYSGIIDHQFSDNDAYYMKHIPTGQTEPEIDEEKLVKLAQGRLIRLQEIITK